MARVSPWIRDLVWFVWPIVLVWLLAGIAGVLAGLLFASQLWRG
jgi:hypothetical protein